MSRKERDTLRKRISTLILLELIATTALGLYWGLKGRHEQFREALTMYLICISTYTAVNIDRNRKE